MSVIDILENAAKRPGMYLPEETLCSYISFVSGCDTGLDGALLSGFREWLISREKIANNMVWWSFSSKLKSQTEEEKIMELYNVILDYWAYREESGIKKSFR